MRVDTLKQLFLEELHDIHIAEQQILKALPKMAKAASATELQQALEQHLEVTEQHVERLGEIFQQLGEPASNSKRCKGMAGLLEEGQEILKKKMDASLKDAAIISAAQRVEHYEMAVYGTLRAFAEQLGAGDVARLLDKTLEEEREADRDLSQIAQGMVNPEASMKEDMEETEEIER